METLNVFDFKTYRHFLKKKISEINGVKALQTKMASAAGCTNSFLSKVLNGPVQLTPDHAIGIAQFLKLDLHESEYFLELVQLERARTKTLKSRTEQRLLELRKYQEHLGRKLKSPNRMNSVEFQSRYYSSWYYAAVHLATGIPEYQTIKNIAQKLQIADSLVESALIFLSEVDFVRKKDDRWLRTDHLVHLPIESFFNMNTHTNWRNKSVSSIQKQIQSNIHYSAVFTLSAEDFEKIKMMCVRFIEQKRKVVTSSKDEKLASMCIDFFEL